MVGHYAIKWEFVPTIQITTTAIELATYPSRRSPPKSWKHQLACQHLTVISKNPVHTKNMSLSNQQRKRQSLFWSPEMLKYYDRKKERNIEYLPCFVFVFIVVFTISSVNTIIMLFMFRSTVISGRTKYTYTD